MSITWAIIPARSGSKGFPGKNVANLMGVPLLAHSINFAKKLGFVDKVVLSTESQAYAEIGEKFGAYIPFLRGDQAAQDSSMEEHILEDLKQKCHAADIMPPDTIVWLRPTHPLRDVETFERAYSKYNSGAYSSVCIVTPEDPRIFFERRGNIYSKLEAFEERSMVRRQDCPLAFRIFGGEIFKMPSTFNIKFLGSSIGYEVADNRCRFDIDHPDDLYYLNFRLSTSLGQRELSHFIHPTSDGSLFAI